MRSEQGRIKNHLTSRKGTTPLNPISPSTIEPSRQRRLPYNNNNLDRDGHAYIADQIQPRSVASPPTMAYNGRRGPNVSEYIANLNAIPSAQDLQAADAEFNLEDDLAMFTNTQFFDFDMGHDTDLSATNNNYTVDGTSAAPMSPDALTLKTFEIPDGTHIFLFLFCRSRPLCSPPPVVGHRGGYTYIYIFSLSPSTIYISIFIFGRAASPSQGVTGNSLSVSLLDENQPGRSCAQVRQTKRSPIAQRSLAAPATRVVRALFPCMKSTFGDPVVRTTARVPSHHHAIVPSDLLCNGAISRGLQSIIGPRLFAFPFTWSSSSAKRAGHILRAVHSNSPRHNPSVLLGATLIQL